MFGSFDVGRIGYSCDRRYSWKVRGECLPRMPLWINRGILERHFNRDYKFARPQPYGHVPPLSRLDMIIIESRDAYWLLSRQDSIEAWSGV